jgi:L-fucose dehydrogenase
MDLHLQGKVIIVTGGGSGIGEAIVREAAREGAIPVIIGHTEATGQAVMQSLRNEGLQCDFVQAELSQEQECKQAVDKILTTYQRLDGLVNNAGVNDSIGLETGSPEAFIQSFRRNLLHYYLMGHYCLPALKESQGAIINVSSKTAITGQGGTSGYAAAKGGQLALTREWAVELLPYHIRVNALVPAEVFTPLYDNWLKKFPNPEEKLQKITSKIPLGQRMTTAQEMADMALFLLSDRASHITGQHIFVDGGYTHLDRAIS